MSSVDITFLTRGHVESPGPNQERRLTEFGRGQVQRRQSQLGNPKFDLVLTPYHLFTVETARVLVGEENFVPIIMMKELFTPRDAEVRAALERLSKKHSDRPLSTYYTEESPDTLLMKRFGLEGYGQIIDRREREGATNILVVNHGLFSCCMVHAQCQADGDPETANQLMDFNQGECDGFVITLGGIDLCIENIKILPPLQT